MDSGNRLGDLQITDPKAMRALAHPVRLAVLERLQRHGPATASQLSPHVGATPSVTSWHLRHLAGFGLVRDAEGGTDGRERRWESAARGFRLTVPPDGEGRSAAHLLAGEIYARVAELPLRWLEETAPELEPEWVALAGGLNTRIAVTSDELAALRDAFEELIAPYVHRTPDERPQDARQVRLLTNFLPELPESPGQ
ncbi:helix-turn-helix transcriptional regulator [Streptomyces roseirectus]|uniref:Helix-turn-helix transcriptional regulator n=1 Tax=Streptomyces roseirectus TaxID=2768066 RepID=A0A7H0I9I0_9ACTN|nr:helix-turn-helix domain-containing protein [Streptomyces roseirectus]QNP69446.1 helix-turn-helix transcriptional regulator [Streptomyces roseirectus]